MQLARLLRQSLRSSRQEHGTTRLAQKEAHENKSDKGENGLVAKDPPPGCAITKDVGSRDWTEGLTNINEYAEG